MPRIAKPARSCSTPRRYLTPAIIPTHPSVRALFCYLLAAITAAAPNAATESTLAHDKAQSLPHARRRDDTASPPRRHLLSTPCQKRRLAYLLPGRRKTFQTGAWASAYPRLRENSIPTPKPTRGAGSSQTTCSCQR